MTLRPPCSCWEVCWVGIFSRDLVFCFQGHWQLVMNLQLPNSLWWSLRDVDLYFDLINSKKGGGVGLNISLLFGPFTPHCQFTNCISWWPYRRAGRNGPKWPQAQRSSVERDQISRSHFLLPCWVSSNQPEVACQLYFFPTKSREYMELVWISKILTYLKTKPYYRVFLVVISVLSLWRLYHNYARC